ncbi:zeta toxin family protein [Candidatus Saccharibacteria bacterium]|nr:zeta toxin family protein [Candidatus Saccharibacteria bacterium]
MSLSEEAVKFVKANKRSLVEQFVDPQKFTPNPHPETFFMAGSPGAGKTEWSRNFLQAYKEVHGVSGILRIDPDDIRATIPGYTGNNSDEVQGAASLAVQKILDHALNKQLSFLFDGTFARYDLAYKNIERAIKHGRQPVILYVHQDPLVAWDITKARELREGRMVPKETFINAYFSAKENVNRCKEEFGNKIYLYLINKNADTLQYKYVINITNVDHYLKAPYTRELLEEKLK